MSELKPDYIISIKASDLETKYISRQAFDEQAETIRKQRIQIEELTLSLSQSEYAAEVIQQSLDEANKRIAELETALRWMPAKDLTVTPEAEKRIAELEHHLSDLLAVIHGDGGHYQSEHGNEAATADAILKWRGMKLHIDKLEEAARFYADPESYRALYQKNAAVMIEKGERAREVLK